MSRCSSVIMCWSLVVVVGQLIVYGSASPHDPTQGFTSLPLKNSNFEVQRPYNVPQNDRYSYVDGVHKMWVYSNDEPHSPNSHTHPRTELRIQGYDYSSGVWQFEGYGYIPSGTSGACVMQVFGASEHATTMMLRVYDGELSYYEDVVVIPHVYDKWFRLNVIHNVDTSKLQVYVNGVLKLEEGGRGGSSHFFKCGVHSSGDSSHYMESRWKDIKVFKKM